MPWLRRGQRLGLGEHPAQPLRHPRVATAETRGSARPGRAARRAGPRSNALGVGEGSAATPGERVAPPLARHHLDREPAQPDRQRAVDHVGERRRRRSHHRRSRRARHPVEVDVGRQAAHSRNATATPLPTTRYAPARCTPAPERWTAIVNPAAGRGRARARLPRVLDALAAADLDVEIVLSADAADLVTLARDAFGRGRAVVACGGDGTVCALAGRRGRRGRRARHRPARLGQRLRPPARHPPRRPRRRHRRAAHRPRGRGRPRARAHRRRRHDVVHHGRQHRVRRGGERVGQRRHLDQRHAALRARDAAHAGDVLAHARARHRRRHDHRDRRVAGRGGQHPHLRERDDDHARGQRARRPARRVRRRSRVARRLPAHVPVGVPRHARRPPGGAHARAARTSPSRRSTPRHAVDLWASGEHAGPLPARLEPVAGALAVVVARRPPT